MIVVLDSGIWISAFQFGGTPQALSIWCSATTLLQSAIRSFQKSVPRLSGSSLGKMRVRAVLTEYISHGTHVAVAGTLQGVCRDPKDDMVFECAVKAHAEIILSGDNDLLNVKTYRWCASFRSAWADRAICSHARPRRAMRSTSEGSTDSRCHGVERDHAGTVPGSSWRKVHCANWLAM